MKIRKGTQLTLINLKRAGRPPINDRSIRHISRNRIFKPTSMHITIKVSDNKADIKSAAILEALHRAVERARLKNLKVIHYTLEYNHIHLLVEAADHLEVKKGMQAFGISFAKSVNRIKCTKGNVYKHRYHLRKIQSPKELKYVLKYIFGNGIHHKRTQSLIDPYNSLIIEKNLKGIYPLQHEKIEADINNSDYLRFLKLRIAKLLDRGSSHFDGLKYVKS